jgi:prolyl-tRNA synthetase
MGRVDRLLGAVIMAHGDDNGLRLPPAVAPVQVVVLAIRDEGEVVAEAKKIAAELSGLGHRVRLDDRVEQSFGRRVTDWELKGVPIRIEIGPRDLADGNVTVVRRDTGDKQQVPVAEAWGRASLALAEVQRTLLAEATALRDGRTVEVKTVDEAAEAAQSGWARLPWAAVGEEGETTLATSGVSVRCLQTADGGLPGPDDADTMAYVARAY